MSSYQAAVIESTDYDPSIFGGRGGVAMGRARRLMPRGMYVGGRRPTDAGHYGSGDIIQLFHDAQLFVSIKGVPQAKRAAAYELIDRIRQMTEAGQYHDAQVAVSRLPDCDPALSPNLPRAQGVSAIRDVCYWAIDKVQKENTGFSLSNAAHAVGQAATSVGEGLGSIATGVGKAAYGAAKGVVSGVGTVAHLAATPAMAAMAIARGDNVANSLGNAFKSAVRDIKDMAPLAQAVIGFVPGVGQGVNAALAAGVALAQGQRIDQALLSGVKGALGPVASAAFDSGLSIARGGSVSDAALNLARTQAAKLPGGAQAFDTAVALAHGQKIQDVLKGQAMNIGQQALERFVSHPLSAADPLTALGRAAKPALSALSPQVDMVARALLNTPALRSLPLDQVSRRLGGVPVEAVRSAVASIAGSAKSAGGRLIPRPDIANRLGAGHTLDKALALAGANNAPPRFTHNPLPPRRSLPGVRRADARGLDSSGVVWLVTSGDTMSKIAKTITGDPNRYPEMAKFNNVANANNIKIGQRLNLPPSWIKTAPPVVATVPVTTPNGTTVTVAVPTVIASAPPPATVPSGMPLIYQGVGPLVAIQKWQDILRRVMGVSFPTTVAAGYGTFGPLTDTTTRAFQAKEGLKIDGKVGDETWNRGLFRFAQMGATTPVGTTGPNPTIPGIPPTITLPPGALPPVPNVTLPPIPSVVPIAVPGTSPPSSTPPFFPTFGGGGDTTATPPPATTPSAPGDTTVAPISTNAKPASNGDWLIPVAAAALAIFN